MLSLVSSRICGQDGFIFPPDDHPDAKWWLTEVSLRMEQEKLAREADEDGPPSEEEDSAPCSDDDLFSQVDAKDLGKEVALSSDDDGEETQANGARPLLPTELGGTFAASTSSWSQSHVSEPSLPASRSP